MKSKFTTVGALLILSIMTSSCSTYHVSTQSLLEQLASTHNENKKTWIVAFPIFLPFTVTGNSLQQLKVLDKNEKEHIIPVTYRTGVRITKKDGNKKTFYFNTLLIKDSTITGKNDHFLGINIKPINLNNIEKIELQE
jgi:hypothetical protein